MMNELNKETFVSVNQFRELFVQQVNPRTVAYADSTYVQTSIPLSKNQPSPASVEVKHWMNTPLKKKE